MIKRVLATILIAVLGIVVLTSAGCAPANPHQTEGAFGPVALQRACVSGRVTDAVTGRVLPDVQLIISPAIGGPATKTNADGFFYTELPGGSYQVRFVKEGYREGGLSVSLKAGETAGREVSLEPTAPVVIDAGKTVTGAAPGTVVTVRARALPKVSLRPEEIRWEWETAHEDGGVSPTLAKEGAAVRLSLPQLAEYKEALLYRLGKEARLLDRWMVVGITPSDLIQAGKVTLTVKAVTGSGSYSDTVDVIADLGAIAAVNPGVRNVPVGRPVLLSGASQNSYAWTVAAPKGSTAVMRDGGSRNPTFIPDVAGTYLIREGGKDRLAITAGRWNGVLVAKESRQRDRWIGAEGCPCHYDDKVSARFRSWRTSGHAQIFTQCVSTVFRYEERCFVCHTVGYGGKGSEGGITAARRYASFLGDDTLWNHAKVPPVIRPKPGNLDTILDRYPEVARYANVQCENCHGPNNSNAHKTLKKTGAKERISLAAEGCGICHDESQAELTYRQWLDAKTHASYGLAITAATVEGQGDQAGDCGRCHAGQGFLAWLERGERAAKLAEKDGSGARERLAGLGLTKERVHPVTCAVCHDPHASGSTFRSATEKVPLREADYSRMHPKEFGKDKGGRGALCITCHSTIWGAYNDRDFPRLHSDLAPHASQGDVLFGQNAFFTPVGVYKSHTRVEDSCVWCHAKEVPKDSRLGYPRRSASHAFKAGTASCVRCHDFSGEELVGAMEADIANLKGAIEDAVAAEIKRSGTVRLLKAGKNEGEVSLTPGQLTTLRLTEAGRSMALELTTSRGSYKVPFDRILVADQPLISSERGQLLAKATWNYFLIKRDGSKGAHNPQFVREVLASTLKRLK